MNYFISDLHIGDMNLITYTHRPFKTVEEEREKIIKNWNNRVTDNDKVYLLGDIGDDSILNELKGEIIIVIGNHDNYERLKRNHPTLEIYKYPIMVDGLWLSHEPITYMPPEIPYLNIHGHLHNLDYGFINRNWSDGNRYFNVSVEKINYTPISILEIKEKMHYIEP